MVDLTVDFHFVMQDIGSDYFQGLTLEEQQKSVITITRKAVIGIYILKKKK